MESQGGRDPDLWQASSPRDPRPGLPPGTEVYKTRCPLLARDRNIRPAPRTARGWPLAHWAALGSSTAGVLSVSTAGVLFSSTASVLSVSTAGVLGSSTAGVLSW